MKIKITNSEPKLISFWDIYGKELDVKNTKTVNFASGPKNYYVVEFEGEEYEVPEDMVDNSIPNNYEGKTPEQVWNAWTEDQREHFLKDHFKDKINPISQSEIIKSNYSGLFNWWNFNIKEKLEEHLKSGQYGKGTYLKRMIDPDRVRAWGGDWITDSNIEVVKDSLMDAGIEPYEYMEPRRFSSPDAESEYLWKRTDELVSEIRPGMEPAGLSNSQIRDIVWAMIQASRDSKYSKYGKGGGVDDFDASHTVKIHKDMPYMASLDGMYDKELPVVEEKTYHFASGPQIYYVVKFNGKLTEIPRRFTEAGYNEMAGKGAHLKADEFQEAAEFLMDKTVFSYSLGQLEPTEHKIKGVHITPKHFNQRHLYFSFYGNEWPHTFNDYDRLTKDQLGDFIAGEQVELKDSQGEPYIVALGDIAGKGKKVDSINVGDEVEFINDSGVTKSRGKIIDIDSDGKYATIDWKDGTHLFYRNINKIWKYNDQAAKGTKIENMDFETRFSKFIKELSWLSNKTGVVIGGHYNDALGEYIEYTNDWTSGDIWRGGKSRETTDAPKGYYRFIKGLEAISNKYGIEVHSTGHVITEHNGMVKYTDDPTSGDINYKELNGKGSKIKENMENKNYYYLKIGNIITDSKNNVYEITGYKKDGILMKRISDFTPGDGVPFETEFEELESKLKSKLVKISTVKHVRDSLNNVLRSINEDLIFSTSRDEALLEMEIADIKNSFKIAEEKAEVRKKEEEVAQAKHEADVLLKKATDTEAAAKDTIEAMEAMITEERHGWQIGKIADYDFEAKVFEQPSEYGINNGRISKLWVYKKVNGKKNTAINYDRGWDIRPTTVKDKKVLKTILSMFPVNADQAGKGKKVGYNPDMFYKKGEEVRVLTGYYKGKNGIVHDVDHDANHIEVEMGDGMIRFLELSDVKKNESNEHKAGKGAKVGDYKIKQGKETNSYGHDIDNILKKGILVIGKKGTKNEGKEFIVRQHTSLNPDLFVLLPTERGNNKTFVANVENYEVKQGWEKAGKGTKVGDLATLTEEENKAWQTAFEYYLNEGKSDSQADKLAWKDLQAEFPRLKDFSGIKEDKSPVQEDFYQAKKSKTQKGKWAILKNGEVIEDGLDEYFAGTTANKRNAEIEYAKMESKKAKAEKPKVGKSTKIKEFGRASVNRILNKALREYEKETGNKLFKKEAKIGKYYHFRPNNPKGVKKCAVPSWASDLAGSVYEGAKITTCQKDGEWFAQNVMIPTKNISKLQARSYAQQIALKIKK